MSYTKQEIINRLEEDTAPKKMSFLYKKEYINYSGKTGGKYYYDIIAEYLLKHVNLFNESNIPKIERAYSYKSKDHKPLTAEERALINKQRRGEEWFARGLLNSKFDHIGKIIDYQTPIKDSKHTKGVGKIDLLAYDENMLSIVELKREYNTETILRAMLEIYTYHCQVVKEKLLKDFKLPSGTTVQKVVLVFKDSPQHQQYKESKLIRELAEKLEVKVFVLDYKLIIP